MNATVLNECFVTFCACLCAGEASSKLGSGASNMPDMPNRFLTICCTVWGGLSASKASGNHGVKSKSFNLRCKQTCKKQHGRKKFMILGEYSSQLDADAALEEDKKKHLEKQYSLELV